MAPLVSLLVGNPLLRHSTSHIRSRLAVSLSSRFASSDAGNGAEKTALVIGCSGALGNAVSRYLGREMGMKVFGADVVEIPSDFNNGDWDLDGFIALSKEKKLIAEVTTELATGVHSLLEEGEALDAIVVASGGWAGDPRPITGGSTLDEIQQGAQEYGETIDKMLHMNLIPVVAAGYTVSEFSAPNGLFVVIGATAALSSTPGMLGYGIAKSGAHHLVRTMGATTGNAIETKVKRKTGRRFRQHAENLDTLSVVGILPTTIDTPSNRQFNPDADYKTWTKPNDIAKEIGQWIEMPALRPHSGALVKVTSAEAGSTFEIVR